MLLVDTSVWSDHLRRHETRLAAHLEAGDVLMHPWVVGEIACGVFPTRAATLSALDRLPSAPVLGSAEILSFIERRGLAGRGIGFIDVHLLASALVAGARLWTRDRRLAEAAAELGCRHEPDAG